MNIRHTGWIGAMSLCAVSFGAPAEPEDLLRSAQAAYSRADYPAAIGFCERAEDSSHDPGLVAFNKAAALYQIGEYRQAELHYRRCLEDARGPRLAQALYNLATCLVKQSGGDNRRLIAEAITFYERSLEQVPMELALESDAQFNLELAKLLYQSAKGRAREESDSRSQTDEEPVPIRRGKNVLRENDDSDSAALNVGEGAPTDVASSDRLQRNRRLQSLPQSGKGTLPPIPEEPESTRLSREDALEHLQRAASRILSERREHRLRSLVPVPANVKDW